MNRNDVPALAIGPDGWCGQAQRRPSPNFDARPASAQIDLLVIHNISLPPGQFGGPYIADLFGNCLDCDAHPYFDQLRTLRVSAHFLIRRDGGLVQFVSANDRAWHAGASFFEGRERCNDFSIGVELEGSDFVPFGEAQYRVLAAVSRPGRLDRRLAATLSLARGHGASGHCPGAQDRSGAVFRLECLLLIRQGGRTDQLRFLFLAVSCSGK